MNGAALAGLGGAAEIRLAAYQRDGTADAGFAGCIRLLGENQVGPLEAEKFTRTGPRKDSYNEEGLETALCFGSGLEEPGDLLDRKCRVLLLRTA
jgi:hypothetical protein